MKAIEYYWDVCVVGVTCATPIIQEITTPTQMSLIFTDNLSVR